MERRLPELGAASRIEDLGLELGVALELLVDDRSNAALDGHLGKELGENTRPEAVKALDLTAEAQVSNDFGSNPTDASKCAGVGGTRHHGNHRETHIGRLPR
jgi:hypothetical protein